MLFKYSPCMLILLLSCMGSGETFDQGGEVTAYVFGPVGDFIPFTPR